MLLLDEPLSNLDAHLREQMRAELRDLQRRIRITTIYVTHDQEEALSLSDRIAIMRDGRIEELDTPSRLYFAPRTAFTAHFIGHAEVLPCRILERAEGAIVVDLALGRITSRCFPETIEDETALAVRPEHIEIAAAEDANGTENVIAGTVERENFAGRLVEYVVKTAAGATVRAQCTSSVRWKVGAPVTLRLAPERCVVVNGLPSTRQRATE